MADQGSAEPRHPVRVVTERTGLTPDVLRAWERRYAAVRPLRSAGGQRLYTDADVARLILLHRATRDGHRIGDVAGLDTRALEALLEEPADVAPLPESSTAADAVVAEAMQATRRLDAAALDAALRRGALALGANAFVNDVVARFMIEVGDRWHAGEVSPAHEHLATGVVRRVLDWVTAAFATPPRAPRIVVATPAGERHELGAMLVAAAAAQEGWRVTFLGASLPATDVARAAQQSRARAVALSVVYASDDATMEALRATADALGGGTTLFVGGRAALDAADRLAGVPLRVLRDIPALRRALRALAGASDDPASA